ncbi:WD40 repeat domain-containing serine/threonine protein kinase [Fuerstiella marisgermanici]|uniref:Serine/threonine-protein kinase PknB n=1 Tax=Fuerstiella marisgermanici TaxID=1891926 RepID=A0A1P8WAK7_9PLAN|nr:WD40 repeat domain-containing serine/threonine-protein kinase [Fuerstiella marisgermanici]APZ91098.1 Serine/threonine-protein kinase PknB [Fuerstiella marisgermanici]
MKSDETAINRGDTENRLALEAICTQFEAAVRFDPGVTIESFLQASGTQIRADLITELIAVDCELRADRGDLPRREEYYVRFPAWCEEVDAAFRMWTELQDDADSNSRKFQHPKRLGDYRIVREIGRGGMGIVYEAVQESLNRRVAIKMLLAPSFLRAESLERFERESRAVAMLHHTNIIDVYGSGVKDDLPYFAMQLVNGRSLNAVICEAVERPTGRTANNPLLAPNRHIVVAKIGADVAGALEYSHRRGLLHRDIKPANLLLDDEGTVWIADFGLAKLANEVSDTTVPGKILGTLRYLSPEAVAGDWDERSDVYSLGTTLYELLTLKPAFPEGQHAELLSRISRRDPPPVSLRSIDDCIPHDLETIVMKAMAFEPTARYSSAQDLADDLQRYIAGEPIAARRSSGVERLWKWARRKPALAGLLTLAAAVAIIGLPLLAFLWLQSESALKTAEYEKQLASIAQQEAETARHNSDAANYGSSMQLTQKSLEDLQLNDARLMLNQWGPASVAKAIKAIGESHAGSATSADFRYGKFTHAAPRDRRGWEWNFLKQQMDPSRMTLNGHSGPVHFVAIHPDDTQICTVGGSDPMPDSPVVPGEVILWDAKSGKQQHVLRGHPSGVMGAAYSPDGTRLATIGMRRQKATGIPARLCLWDTKSGQQLKSVELSGDYPRPYLVQHAKRVLPGVQFSDDGRYVITWPNPVEVRVAETLDSVWKDWDGRGIVTLPDGQIAVNVFFTKLRVRDLTSGAMVAEYPEPGHAFYDVAVTGNPPRLTALRIDAMALWESSEFDSAITVFPAPGITWGMLTAPGDQIVYGDRSGILRLAPLDDSKPPRALPGHATVIEHGAISHNGQWLVTASADGTAKVWDVACVQQPRVMEHGFDYDSIADIAFSSDGTQVRFAASRDGGKLQGWVGQIDVDGGNVSKAKVSSTTYSNWPRTDFAFNPDGTLLAAPEVVPDRPVRARGFATSNRVVIWESDTGNVRHTIDFPTDEITSVAWHRDGGLIAAAGFQDGRSFVRIFSTDNPAECLQELAVDDRRVLALCFGVNQIATATDHGISVWRGAEGLADEVPASSEQSSRPHNTWLNSQKNISNEALQFQSDYRIKSAGSVCFLDFSPDGRLLAAADSRQGLVCVYDAQTGSQMYRTPAPRAVCSVRFSPNGRRLAAVGYDSLIYLYDAETGYQLLSLNGANAPVGTAAINAKVVFSPDGRRIATSDWRGRVSIWEAAPMDQ